MKRFTKVLSLFLAFIMLASLLPLAAFAGNLDNESHIVQFKLNYNGAKKLAAQKVSDGECAVEPEDAVRTGWILEYWYQKTDSGIQKYDFSKPVTEDLTLYARWKEDITYWGPIWNRNIQSAISAENNDGDTEETQYSVTFEANGDNVNNLPAAQYVSEGNCAEEPDAPTREGYLFLGWSAGTNGILYNFDTEVTGDITLYALWAKIGDSSSAGSENGGSSVYSITGLTVQEDSVSVTANAVEECRLVVVFYADDDEMNTVLATASAVVPAGIQMEAVEAQITDSLPEYFIAVAQLFDSKNEALCNTYTCIEYTRSYEEYAAKTIHDFPGKTVLNFDESSDNNFGVLADDVKTVVCGDEENVLAESSENQYVFEQAGAEIAGLSAGDILYIDDNIGEGYLLKVGSVTTENGKTIITADTDTALTDFYTYLKINKEVYVEEAEAPQTFGMLRGNIVDKDETYSNSIGLSGSWKNGPIEIVISGEATLKVHLVVVYDLELFGEDYCQFDLKATAEATYATTVTGKFETGSKEPEGISIKLPEVLVPFGITGLSAKASPKIAVKFKLEGGLFMSQTDKVFETGFTFNTIDGYHPVEKNSDGEQPEIDVGAKIEITVGPEISLSINFLDEAFEGKLVFFAGARLKGEAMHSLVEQSENKHGCSVCIDGSVDLVANVKAKLTYKITKKIKGTPLDATLIEKSIPLCYYVFSLINDPDSMFHGAVSLVITEDDCTCPNFAYRVNVYTTDAAGNKLSNCPITITKVDSDKEYSGNSPYTTWLYYGEYAITAEIGGKTVSDSFEISDSAKDIYISENGISDAELIGRYYTAQTTGSYIEFKNENSGTIHISPGGNEFNKNFTYTIKDDIITIKSVDNDFGIGFSESSFKKTLRFKILFDNGIVLKSLDAWGAVLEGDIFRKQVTLREDYTNQIFKQTTMIIAEGYDNLNGLEQLQEDQIPYIKFNDKTTGEIALYHEGRLNLTEFRYSVRENNTILIESTNDSGLYLYDNYAEKMLFEIIDEDSIKLYYYSPVNTGYDDDATHLIPGITYIGDIFMYNG